MADSSQKGTAALAVEPIDLTKFIENGKDEDQCARVAEYLHEFGIVIVRDPRVAMSDNDQFLDMMERYFEQPREDTKPDIHPELHYQVGTTPEFVEKARDHCGRIGEFSEENQALTLCPPEADPKWRFFWRIGPRPSDGSAFEDLNAQAVVPKAFEAEWGSVMDRWGNSMIKAVETVAKMAAIGLGLEEDAFVRRMKEAPHLLAPTGSDLNKYGTFGRVFANFHYDLNFLTIHGKSRYPGLFIWLRDGTKMPVKMPDGCLLIQAGKQIEYLTGGYVLAGFHEVVVSEGTILAMERRRKENKSLWRISSTLFSHINSSEELEPLGPFATEEAKAKFPKTRAGDQVRKELEAIGLKSH